MRCEDVTEKLASGGRLGSVEQEHVTSCPACSELLGLFTGPSAELSESQIRRLRVLATSGLKPVRPLPSNWALTAVFVCLAIALTCISAAALRMFAVRVMSPWQMAIYFGLLLAMMLGCAFVVVREMIPGAAHRVHPGWIFGFSFLVLCGTVTLLFPSLNDAGFLHNGVGCLRAGSECAVFAAVVLGAVARLGFARSRVMICTATGFLAGVVGVATLALHCALLTIPHILVWHVAVLWLGTGFGALIGFLISRRKNFGRA